MVGVTIFGYALQLQCVAVFSMIYICSVLQCIAVYCRVLQGVAGCCRVLQCVAGTATSVTVFGNALQLVPRQIDSSLVQTSPTVWSLRFRYLREASN